MKRLLAPTLFTALLSAAPAVGTVVASTPPAETGSTETGSADSAAVDAVVEEFFAALAVGDPVTALSMFAAEEMAEGFDFAASVEANGYLDVTVPLSSLDGPAGVELNRAILTGRSAQWLQAMMWALLSDEEITSNGLRVADDEWVATFLDDTDPSHLADLIVVDIADLQPEADAAEQYEERMAVQAAIFGADDRAERVALIRVGGAEFAVGFTLLRYGDNWSVMLLSSNLAGLGAIPFAHPMTAEEFAAEFGG